MSFVETIPVSQQFSGDTDAYKRAKAFFFHTSPDIVAALAPELDALIDGPHAYETTTLADLLLIPQHSDTFFEDLRQAGIPQEDLRNLFLSENMLSLTVAMTRDPFCFRGSLGLLFTQLRLSDLPEAAQSNLQLHPVITSLHQKDSNMEWFQCPETEERMTQSIEEDTVMNLEANGVPYLLLKFKGKLSALCLENFVTPSGVVFLKGNWYSPRDLDSREAYRRGFDHQQGSMPIHEGTWVFTRAVELSSSKAEEAYVDDAVIAARNRHDSYKGAIFVDKTTYARTGYQMQCTE